MKNFALIGAAGYIAPRHMKAIKETGNNLSVVVDTNDSVGIIDSYFPHADFFTRYEEFEAYLEDNELDYISICSPNYLHLSHIKCALRNGIDVICEKPLVLSSKDIDTLLTYEEKYSAKVNSILQLRLHPAIIALKENVAASPPEKVFNIDLTYLTSRGNWYLKSWKGQNQLSGGVAANIGVHFYDMLHFVFGNALHTEVHYRTETSVAGHTRYDQANVRWFLSIDKNKLPEDVIKSGKTTFRSIQIKDETLEFSEGFTDLHTKSYELILQGNGFGLEENRAAIETIEIIRNSDIINNPALTHSLLLEKK